MSSASQAGRSMPACGKPICLFPASAAVDASGRSRRRWGSFQASRARVNLSTKRVAVDWRETEGPPPLGEALTGLGYDGFLYEAREDAKDPQLGRLIRALAVAGFAALTILGLSISVCSGAAVETRQLFHWLSAAIALHTLASSRSVF